MIRLAILDGETARWQAIGARLRGATLHLDTAPGDAVAFPGTSGADPAEIEQALQEGKHVLLVADAGFSRGKLQKWSDLARQARVRFSIVNPDRYLPSRQLLRQQLDAGKLGAPGLIRIHRWAAPGALLNDLDLVLWYFGTPANVVYASENETCLQIHLGFPKGGMALIDHAVCLPAGDRYHLVSMICANGAAYADDHQNVQLVFQGGSARAVCAGESIAQWTALLQEFVQLVEHDASCVGPTWDQVLDLNEAVLQSLRTKQAVALEEAS